MDNKAEESILPQGYYIFFSRNTRSDMGKTVKLPIDFFHKIMHFVINILGILVVLAIGATYWIYLNGS